ncbi:MAG TPA: ABC transporter permease, partial [Planctomycetota bacterium]|nr:ABC transporter permease [Planctomycetota bacterium]
MDSRRRRLQSVLLPVLAGGVFLVLWALAVKWSGTRVFPSPLGVVKGLGELERRGILLPYIRDSMFRVAAGYLFAVAVGVPFGLFLGLSQRASAVFNPLIQVLRPISPLAWIPISIVLFGIGNEATIFLVVLASVFPIVLASSGAVHSVPEIYLRAGRNVGLSQAATIRRILLPAALPQILVGLRVALGIAWLVVVAAEMIAVDSGLGYLVIDARNAGNRYDLVVCAM